jgi:hypothetical protein
MWMMPSSVTNLSGDPGSTQRKRERNTLIEKDYGLTGAHAVTLQWHALTLSYMCHHETCNNFMAVSTYSESRVVLSSGRFWLYSYSKVSDAGRPIMRAITDESLRLRGPAVALGTVRQLVV